MSRKSKKRKRKKQKQQKNAIRHLQAAQIKQPAPTENTVSTSLQSSMPISESSRSLVQSTPRGGPAHNRNIEVRELDFTNLHQLAYEKWKKAGSHRLSPLNNSTIAIRAADGETIKIDIGHEQDVPPEISQYYKRIVVKAPANLVIVLAKEAKLMVSLLADIRESIPSASQETQVVGYICRGLEWTDNALRDAIDDLLYLEFPEFYPVREGTSVSISPTPGDYHVECYDVTWGEKRLFVSVVGKTAVREW
jgi:hypothetical protein